MSTNAAAVLNVLKAELAFSGRGGYQRSQRTPWRAPLIFEDSPTCAAYYSEHNSTHCGVCPLMQFVPTDKCERKLACRYIPLTERGDTLDSLYHTAYEPEIEAILRGWLAATIEHLDKANSEDGRA